MHYSEGNSAPEGNGFVLPIDSRSRASYFPRGKDIKCFVILYSDERKWKSPTFILVQQLYFCCVAILFKYVHLAGGASNNCLLLAHCNYLNHVSALQID